MNKAILFSILSLVHKTNADDYHNYQGENYYQDEDEDEDEDDIVDPYTFLVFVLIVITCLMVCVGVCNNQNTRYGPLRLRWQTQANHFLSLPQANHLAASVEMANPSQSFPIPTPSEGKQVRRQYVLMNIIHKKVHSESSKHPTNSDNVLEGTENDTIVLPHEQILSSRFRENSKSVLRDEEEGAQINEKDNIYVASLRSLRLSSRFKIQPEVEDSLYSPKSCPICCEDYQKGDDIAWSKNEKCHHAYHVDCLLEWLAQNNDCPMCRESYFCFDNEE